MSGGSTVGVADLFHMLESNKLSDVEEIKQVFHDHFLSTKDNWLVNGLFDYYLSTNSLRTIEVLAGVREPHDKHLLDRLTETISKPTNNSQRLQVLTVLGHVARRQPTWLYKLANHPLFRELLKLLKVESDAVSLMSGLLLLVALLPMLPAALGPYLHDIFEVFSRLATYYHFQSSSLIPALGTNSISMDKDQLYLLHLQVGLYSLFHRLYAMYPCNFIAYLKFQYAQRDQEIFKLTIKPMLDSVRLHPLLVTASKETETNATRWKKMEHHDVVAECGRFALDRTREEILAPINLRATPIPEHLYPYTPVSGSEGLSSTGALSGEEDAFWSPSMAIPPQSPPPLQSQSHEVRSAPSTPNNNNNSNSNNSGTANSNNSSVGSNSNNININQSSNINNRSGSSPPEAAVEATPETTPVKDIRQLSGGRQLPVGSAAVRALGAFGNGTMTGNSRPSTPISTSANPSAFSGIGGGGDGSSILTQKINRLVAERQIAMQASQRSSNTNFDNLIGNSQNGKNDSWNEDQEVLEIVNSQSSRSLTFVDRHESVNEEGAQGARIDFSKKVRRLRFHSQCQTQIQCPIPQAGGTVRRSKSCPDIKTQKKLSTVIEKFRSIVEAKNSEDAGTQTFDLIPYEHLLFGLLEQRDHEKQISKQNSDSRLSPSTMLDRYIEACARTKSSSGDTKKNNKRREDEPDDNNPDEFCDNQPLQLMQMQLLFEKQRREVHAERNRRLLGKLRDSRALEEQNTALTDRLRMAGSEIEALKNEIDKSKKENRAADERYSAALLDWQSKCIHEQTENRILRERLEAIELELKNEKKKVNEYQQQTKAAEAMLFDAAHQLKCALKAASRGEELKKTIDLVQKRFLLLGEAQARIHERCSGPVSMSRQEAAQIQRAYSEELSNLKRQLDSKISTVEALRVRLVELENRETRTEAQLVDQQRLLQEAKERSEAELQAVESKYKAQVEINLLLESRILELHGHLEAATSGCHSVAVNLTSSASPKERSPPLSGSLASSSEGSLAFHSGTGIISDCCDSAGEISNLHAIVEPAPSTSSQANTPSRSSQRQVPKRD